MAKRADQPADSNQSLGSLHDYWSMLMRRRSTVSGVFAVVTTTVVLGSFLIPPAYTAQTTIMVKHGREFFYRAAVGEANDASLYSLQEMVNSEVEILRSRDVAERVIREMGPAQLYPDLLGDWEAQPDVLLAVAVDRFRERLTVMDVLESSIIRISFVHRSPRVAAEALNLLIDRYKDKHVEIFSQKTTGFLSDQLRGYEAKLSESEKELEEFRQQHGVYSFAEQKSLLLNQRVVLDTELNNTEFRIAELQQRLTFLDWNTSSEPSADRPYVTESRESLVTRRGELSSELQRTELRLAELGQQFVVFRDRARSNHDAVAPHPGVERYPSIDEAFIRLLDLQLHENELRRDYSETSRSVKAVRNEIALVEVFLRGRGAYVEDVLEATIRDELDGLVARRYPMLEQIRELDATIRAFDVRYALDELSPLQIRRTRIRQEIARLGVNIMVLDRYENELRQFERRVVLDERNYEAFMEKSEAARVLEELDRQKMINLTVIEAASPPISSSNLSKKLRVVLGAFVGLFAGVAASIFQELVAQS